MWFFFGDAFYSIFDTFFEKSKQISCIKIETYLYTLTPFIVIKLFHWKKNVMKSQK